FEPLINGNNADVAAIGLTLEVADVVNIIPADGYAVVIERHQAFKILAHFIVVNLLAVQGRDAHLAIGGKQFLGAVHHTRGFGECSVFAPDDADVFTEVPDLFQGE